MFLLIDADNAFPLTPAGEPKLFDVCPHPTTTRITLPDGTVAARLERVRAAELVEYTGDARSHAGHPQVARAVALLRARERERFDPADGSPLTWDDAGAQAHGASGRPILPRIDPSVIGVVQNADGSAILLGENARRPGYFTCIAGYVDVGETAEAAFAREVMEETGRRIHDVRYVCSQPWALSGALMLGFTARTSDVEPQSATDGELTRIIWASREDLAGLTLAREGTIARDLIARWARGDLAGGN